jgi:hypothetical protein
MIKIKQGGVSLQARPNISIAFCRFLLSGALCDGVLVSVLAWGVVDHGIEPQSTQTKYYKMSIYCLFNKQRAKTGWLEIWIMCLIRATCIFYYLFFKKLDKWEWTEGGGGGGSRCYLTPSVNFTVISWGEQITCWWDDDDIHFVLNLHALSWILYQR